ncbi:hypothetical protein Pla111_33530 [Botrimarina hoheduenensis]|uniref:Uncharacterized protein n=1 Tax=Botrimarina hoheduenensis TaxID=2528000 RepID=A0A5C5VRM8_9BACT|nr:hypothetical protein Pla111_33530 [Botrimarina hoheduenensis]
MIDGPQSEVPTWLADITPSQIADNPFPLLSVLTGSLYYPCSGFDGRPVRNFSVIFKSFVYVDYGIDEEQLDRELQQQGFNGYHLLGQRSVQEQELIPNGWTPSPPLAADIDQLNLNRRTKSPYCRWMLFERDEDIDDSHGPIRFSLLYLCADGVAAFQALYLANKGRPKAVAIIQPGRGWGGNWTDFEDPDKIFARCVLGNPEGKPEYLVYGGRGDADYYSRPCWPQYTQELWCSDTGRLRLWGLQ